MALHTHGNQPSRQRTLNTVDSVYTTSTTNEEVVEIGYVHLPPSHDIHLGSLEHGYFMRCNEESYKEGERDESYNSLVLLKDHIPAGPAPIIPNPYGALYNWYAATSAKGISNTGWHVPTRAEFDTIQILYGGEFAAGGPLKEAGLTHWDSPNTNADNSSGFTALGSGYRTTAGQFSLLGKQTAFRSSTGTNLCLFIRYDDDHAGNSTSNEEGMGWPIRLIKDSTSLSNGDTSIYTGNDGKIYSTICIGTQEWMSQNLDETKYADGSTIPLVIEGSAWAALTTDARCYYDSSPTATAATNISETSFTANWTNNDIVTGYYLDVSTNSLFSSFVTGYNNKTLNNVLSERVTGLETNNTYYYRLRSIGRLGTSNNSNVISTLTIATNPSNLTASTISYTRIDLSWNDNSTEEDGFEIERSRDNILYTLIHTTASNITNYSDENCIDGQLYYYRVRSFNGTTYSSYSNIASSTTSLAPPSLLAITPLSDTSVYLTWQRNSINTRVTLIERSVDGTSWSEVGSVLYPTVIYTDSTCVKMTRYYYRIRENNGSLYSDYSNTVNDWTAMRIPITASGNGTGVVTMALWSSETINMSVTGNANFYDNVAGNTGETKTKQIVLGARRYFFLKLTSGSASIFIFSKNTLTKWGDVDANGWGLVANGPIITGMITTDLARSITELRLSGNQSLSGSIADLPPNITFCVVQGTNTLSGNVSLFPSSLMTVEISGSNTITGNLSGFKIAMHSIYITGNSTISGATTDLPAALTFLRLEGNSTLSGNVSEFPATLITLYLVNTTITGDIAGLPTSLKYYSIYGTNTISGTISGIKAGALQIRLYGLNTIGGNLSDLPSSVRIFDLVGNNQVTGYVTGYAWGTNRTRIILWPAPGYGLSSAEVDQVLIDASGYTWESSTELIVSGNNAARTSASNTAKTALNAMGVYVETN